MRYLLIIYLLFTTNYFFGQSNVKDDFEGNGTISTWFGDDCGMNNTFSNPYQTGINKSITVLKYTDSGGQYANVRFDVPVNFDLSTHSTFSLKIYVPSSGITGDSPNQISLKLQDGTLGSPWATQSEIIKPITLNQWQIVTFDFANDNYINLDSASQPPTNRTDFNRVLLQVNGENNTNQVIAYIDDFLYDGTINVLPNPVFDNLIWSDEFDGNGAINTSKWFHQTRLPNGRSWYNGEIQHYTNRVDNSSVSGGFLKITAKKETFTDQGRTKQYTSARLNSKFAFTYGKVEVRAKLPTGHGTWPAIWMLGKNITEPGGYWASTYGTTGWPTCGEIDIMEHWGRNQNYVQSAMHTPSSSGSTVNHGGRVIGTVSSEFHIYTLEWSSEKMVFKVDGIEHYTYQPETQDSSTWPFDTDQYLLLNIAIESSIASSFTESSMEIDYVRVYQESTTSVSDIDNLKKIVVYPNPVKDRVAIQIPSNIIGAKATLYSLLGNKIQSFIQNEVKKEYNFSSLKKGMYILKFEKNGKILNYKMLKI